MTPAINSIRDLTGSQCKDSNVEKHGSVQTTLYKAFCTSCNLLRSLLVMPENRELQQSSLQLSKALASMVATLRLKQHLTLLSILTFPERSSTYCRHVIRESQTWIKYYTQFLPLLLGDKDAQSRSIGETPAISAHLEGELINMNSVVSGFSFSLFFHIFSWMADLRFCIRGILVDALSRVMLVYICMSFKYKWCEMPAKDCIGLLRRMVHNVNRIGPRTEPLGIP